MDPSLVMFAIESAVKLGTKFNDVLVDNTVQKSLVLPVGTLYGNVKENEAQNFFARSENRHLLSSGGEFYGFDGEQLLAAVIMSSALGVSVFLLFGRIHHRQFMNAARWICHHALEQLQDDAKNNAAAITIPSGSRRRAAKLDTMPPPSEKPTM